MADMRPFGSPNSAADQVARGLMASARRDPSLLRRPDVRVEEGTLEPEWELPSLFPWRPALAAGDLAQAGGEMVYLEELVSLAAEAAERAEDASQRVSAAGHAISRSRVAFAVVGICGLVVGLAGAAGSLWNAQQRQTQVAQELHSVRVLQKQADDRLAAVIDAEKKAAPPVQPAAAKLPPLQTIPIPTRPQWSVQPVQQEQVPRRIDYQRPPMRQVYTVTPQLMFVRVMVNIQRDIGSLFR